MKRSLKPILFIILHLQVVSVVDGHISRDKREASLMRLQDGIKMASSSSRHQPTSTESSFERQPTRLSQFWPPWPFDKLGKRGRMPNERLSDGSKAHAVWVAVKKRTSVSVRQCREISASLYCHLPPALPPIMLLASIPKQVNNRVLDDATEVASRKIVPLISVPFIRNLALGGLVITLISWGDAELHRKRQLTPILQHRSVSRASVTLPPFLPEEIQDDEHISFGNTIEYSQTGETQLQRGNGISKLTDRVESFYTNWKQTREQRKIDTLNARRKTIYNQLVALQSSKKQNGKSRANSADTASKTTGFALVTGASTGIGRALATELARWGVSLVLVARNEKALMALAQDLNKCYGVQCYALPADLSVPDAAESIHRTTTNYGLTVDILVNNAGVATSGPAVDTSMEAVQNIMFVNALSSVKLAILYSRDMVKRRKGRILNVSSMAGLASSVPNASVYGASKAFLKSLSLSMSKELENFGIGVTTLMPGAVTTNFRHSSGMENDLCWRVPFYARPAELVAHLGITSLLDGDAEVVPGLINRLFAKVVRPLLPRRLEAICIEAAFKPLAFPQFGPRNNNKSDGKVDDARQVREAVPNPQSPPKLLQLEDRKEPEPQPGSVDENNDQSETVSSRSDPVRKDAEKVDEVSDVADTGPGHTDKDVEESQVKEPRKETKGKETNRKGLRPNTPKRSADTPNLLLQESLLQTEKVQL